MDKIQNSRKVYCSVPKTSQINYITGQHALNLIAEDGSSADWHGNIWYWYETESKDGYRRYWFDFDSEIKEMSLSCGKMPRTVTIAGIDTYSTSHILGNCGIIECKEWLSKTESLDLSQHEKVYRANYVRAILDLAYDSLIE